MYLIQNGRARAVNCPFTVRFTHETTAPPRFCIHDPERIMYARGAADTDGSTILEHIPSEPVSVSD